MSPPKRDLSAKQLQRRRRHLRVLPLVLSVAAGFGLILFWGWAIGGHDPFHGQPPPDNVPKETQPPVVTSCFTPAQACEELIVDALDHAQSEIRVQAYGFTAAPILSTLVSANQRGVNVSVILDKSDERFSTGRKLTGAELVADAGIPVFIDFRPAIAHSKVIVIDRHIVITGSYNFTAAAERRNAENVAIIDSEIVANAYLANWEARRELSRRFAE